LKGIDYLVVQASYHSPVVDLADVILPSPIWAERGGNYVTAGKRAVNAHPVIQRYGSLQDEGILQQLIEKIGVLPSRS
jgi:predicted molibdopterin-dependent oxidoreductase YjgC